MRMGKFRDFLNSFLSTDKGVLLLLVLWVLAIYTPSLSYNFLPDYDDGPLVLANRAVVSFLPLEAFTQFVFGLYHPLTTLSFAIDYLIWHDNALGFRITNLLLHVINSFLVFRLLKSLNVNQVYSVVAALIFLAHPLHVESVVWISERKDLLYSAFFLLGLLCFTTYLRAPSLYRYIALLVFFLLAGLSKPSAIAFVPVIIAALIVVRRSWKVVFWVGWIPFLVLGVALGVVTIIAQYEAGFIRTSDQWSSIEMVVMWLYAVAYYPLSFVFPLFLSPKHFYPETLGFLHWALSLVGGLLIVASIVGSFFRKLWAFGLLFYLLAILPSLKLIPTGNDLVSDRYAYLPLLGCIYALIVVATMLAAKREILMYCFASACLLVLSGISFSYIQIWRSELTLWNSVAHKHPQHSIVFLERGRAYAGLGQWDNASLDLGKSLSIDPNNPLAYNSMGVVLQQRGKVKEAYISYVKAIGLDSNYAEAYANRGMLQWQLGNSAAALNDFNRALQLAPLNPDNHNNMGIAMAELGNNSTAANHFKEALRLQPNLQSARENLKKVEPLK